MQMYMFSPGLIIISMNDTYTDKKIELFMRVDKCCLFRNRSFTMKSLSSSLDDDTEAHINQGEALNML